jgi:hypothetical protein
MVMVESVAATVVVLVAVTIMAVVYMVAAAADVGGAVLGVPQRQR